MRDRTLQKCIRAVVVDEAHLKEECYFFLPYSPTET